MSAVRASGGGRKSNDALSSVGDPSLTRVNPPPECRDDNAKQIWKSQSKLMIERGTLSREDFPMLLSYCNAFSMMLEADRDITKEGFYSETADGSKKKHPAVNVRNDSVSQLKMIGSLLGLDPMSRSRIVGGGSNKKEDLNEFGHF